MDPSNTIEVMYSCEECGLEKAKVKVEARTTEDVVQWMEKTAIQAIARDRSRRSPFCQAKKITETWIPITGASKIGGPSEN